MPFFCRASVLFEGRRRDLAEVLPHTGGLPRHTSAVDEQKLRRKKAREGRSCALPFFTGGFAVKELL
jgi:hypothetical protein